MIIKQASKKEKPSSRNPTAPVISSICNPFCIPRNHSSSSISFLSENLFLLSFTAFPVGTNSSETSSSSGMLGSSFKFPAHSSFDCSLNQSDCALLSLGLLTGSDMEQFSHRTDSTATAKLILPQFRYFHSFLTRCFERLRSRYYHSWSSSL